MTNQELITQWNYDGDLVKTKQEIMKDVTKALQDKGMNHLYIVDKLQYIMDTAYTINNNGDKMPDFKVMLKWVELLLKLSWIEIDNKIQIAIFNNIPKQGETLRY